MGRGPMIGMLWLAPGLHALVYLMVAQFMIRDLMPPPPDIRAALRRLLCRGDCVLAI